MKFTYAIVTTALITVPLNGHADNLFNVKFKPAPEISSLDGQYSFKVGGRIQADAAVFDDDKTDHTDGTTLRRARLNVSGKAGEEWKYKLEIDFANNATTITDGYVQYVGFKNTAITVGQYKEPFSLENLTSSRFITFIERASMNSFAPGRNIGIGATHYGDHHTLQLGFFGQSTGTTSSDDEGHSYTARLAIAPINEESKLIHLGVAGSIRTPDSATDTVRFRARPETGVTSMRVVDTTSLSPVDYSRLAGAEAAFVYGPFSIQGEYASNHIDFEGGMGDATLHGHYIQASYFFTGETRPYSSKKGTFGRVSPLNQFSLDGEGWGAIEAAFRYSNLQLNDAPLVTGGEMDSYTFGINWHPTKYVRFMINHSIIDTDGFAVVADDDPSVTVARAQIDF